MMEALGESLGKATPVMRQLEDGFIGRDRPDTEASRGTDRAPLFANHAAATSAWQCCGIAEVASNVAAKGTSARRPAYSPRRSLNA